MLPRPRCVARRLTGRRRAGAAPQPSPQPPSPEPEPEPEPEPRPDPVGSLCDGVQALLGVGDEASAELQLFSFCAASCLGTQERTRALNAVNTVERLQYTTGEPLSQPSVSEPAHTGQHESLGAMH